MARQKNSPESEASIQTLRKVRNAVFAKLSEKYPALTMVTSVGIPGNTTLRLERGGGAAFHYRDRFIVLVDRQYIAPKDGSSGDSTKKQVRVWDIFKTLYNNDISILSFMSGDTEELTKLFTYKVCRTGGFNKYNKHGNSIWLSDNDFDVRLVESNLIKAIEDGIKTVNAILGEQNFAEDAYGATG
jgi:hypothetical protein